SLDSYLFLPPGLQSYHLRTIFTPSVLLVLYFVFPYLCSISFRPLILLLFSQVFSPEPNDLTWLDVARKTVEVGMGMRNRWRFGIGASCLRDLDSRASTLTTMRIVRVDDADRRHICHGTKNPKVGLHENRNKTNTHQGWGYD
ncbi:hypothetical protein K439DRAFT_1642595, partial [Ramaria rubella]